VERTGGPDIPLTQDQLALMLAVGRSYISRVLRSLKQRGILETRRGFLYIRDIDELRRLACECNDSVRDHFEEVLNGVYPSDDELIAA
jgi:DNA-binding transcriptional regulator YhcF (GntR family)